MNIMHWAIVFVVLAYILIGVVSLLYTRLLSKHRTLVKEYRALGKSLEEFHWFTMKDSITELELKQKVEKLERTVHSHISKHAPILDEDGRIVRTALPFNPICGRYLCGIPCDDHTENHILHKVGLPGYTLTIRDKDGRVLVRSKQTGRFVKALENSSRELARL